MSTRNLHNYLQELSATTIVAFVKQKKGEMSDKMRKIYEKVKEVTKAEIRRMSEEEVLNINNTILKKVNHIFMLEEFAGNAAYDHLLSKKSTDLRIFGVILLESMFDNETDTSITSHWIIQNNIFQDLKICTSNLNSVEKGKLENLVKIMNGSFTNVLSSDVTHLVTNSTKTAKYLDAYNLDIPIYHTEWINHIWNKWKKQENIPKADSTQYDVFKLPPLFDLKIAATGMSLEKREEMSNMIEENGGKFEQVFKSNETDVLVMDKADPDNSKFKIAIKYKIPVLTENWISESIKSGYALSYNDFALKRPKSVNSSSSSISMNESVPNLSIEEPKKEVPKLPKPNPVLIDRTNEQFLSAYTIGQAKKLGHIFDGYVFYLYNFPVEYYFKVGKLISTCGGIRITELDQSITHILCFDKDNIEDFYKKTVEKDSHGCFVDYKWLVECFKEEKLLSETDYVINANLSASNKIIPPSPLSQKAIQSLNVSITKSTDEKKKLAKTVNRSAKKELSSSKMLDFTTSRADDLIQSSIEANHKKLKQMPNIATNRKRSQESDLNDASKKRKISDDGQIY